MGAEDEMMCGYYRLSPEMKTAVRSVVGGKVIHDLGCGPHFLAAKVLLTLGAKKVVCVDYFIDLTSRQRVRDERIEFEVSSFMNYEGSIDVAFVSWPTNSVSTETSIASICRRAQTIVYVGRNDSFTACGTPQLYLDFVHRDLIHEVRGQKNDLLILGPMGEKIRPPTQEEAAGLAVCRYLSPMDARLRSECVAVLQQFCPEILNDFSKA